MVKNKTNAETHLPLYANPLTVIFGTYLAQERRKLHPYKSLDEICVGLGVSSSFYRMIESGNARIHPKHISKIISVFEASNISFDALAKLVIAIQTLDLSLENVKDTKRNKEDFRTTLNSLKTADSQLSALFTAIDSVIVKIEMSIEKDKFSDDINKAAIELRSFLESNSSLRLSTEEGRNQLLKQFYEIPTIYADLGLKFISDLVKLPVGISFDSLWKWEESKIGEILNLFAIIEDSKIITRYKNLDVYLYKYLWEKKFNMAHFIFCDASEKSNATNLFKSNLKKSYQNKNLSKHDIRFPNYDPDKFDKILDEKIIFHFIKRRELDNIFLELFEQYPEYYHPFKILTENYKDGLFKNNIIDSNQAWLFELENNIVGFKARTEMTDNDKNDLTLGGYSQSFGEALVFKKIVDNLINHGLK